MKKFVVEHVGRTSNTISQVGFGHERAGVWNHDEEKPPIRTPALWIATKGGAVPHLTHETLEMGGLKANPDMFAGLLIPFQDHVRSIDVYQAYKKGVADFVGLPGTTTLITPLDPLQSIRPGYQSNKFVSMWDNGNRENVDVHKYLSGVEAMKADAFVALCDGETPKDCGAKRIGKATLKSTEYLENTLEKYSIKPEPRQAIFGAFEGGFDAKFRQNSAKFLSKLNVDGYFLDGFHLGGEDSFKVKVGEELAPILKDAFQILSPEKPRLYAGMCDPKMTLELVSLGVDMFDTSYAYFATENGAALNFRNTIEPASADSNESFPALSETSSSPNGVHKPELPFMFSLKDDRYKEDFSPIVKSCSCYTCRCHTRAYINHLLNTKEMLGPVLLMIHNLFHLGTFFVAIRKSISDDKFYELFCAIDKSL